MFRFVKIRHWHIMIQPSWHLVPFWWNKKECHNRISHKVTPQHLSSLSSSQNYSYSLFFLMLILILIFPFSYFPHCHSIHSRLWNYSVTTASREAAVPWTPVVMAKPAANLCFCLHLRLFGEANLTFLLRSFWLEHLAKLITPSRWKRREIGYEVLIEIWLWENECDG